jgi:hypothetical protein
MKSMKNMKNMKNMKKQRLHRCEISFQNWKFVEDPVWSKAERGKPCSGSFLLRLRVTQRPYSFTLHALHGWIRFHQKKAPASDSGRGGLKSTLRF